MKTNKMPEKGTCTYTGAQNYVFKHDCLKIAYVDKWTHLGFF